MSNSDSTGSMNVASFFASPAVSQPETVTSGAAGHSAGRCPTRG